MRIVNGDSYSIHVYSNEHPPPHCHIRWNNGEESVVSLQTLDVILGKKINNKVRYSLSDDLEQIIESWEKQNPNKHEDYNEQMG